MTEHEIAFADYAEEARRLARVMLDVHATPRLQQAQEHRTRQARMRWWRPWMESLGKVHG